MSKEYYIVCHECKKKAHIGCVGMGGLQLWYGEENAMNSMRNLLESCLFHIDKIGMVWEQSEEDDIYEEIL